MKMKRIVKVNGVSEMMSLKKLVKWVGVDMGKKIWSESK